MSHEVTITIEQHKKYQSIEAATKWILIDGAYKPPEDWNWLCRRWYKCLQEAILDARPL